MSDEPFIMWVVYEKPRDYPIGWLARMFEITPDGPMPTTTSIKADNLKDVRKFLERRGLVCLPRADVDDSIIVETWL
jgi:hypothetical protein